MPLLHHWYPFSAYLIKSTTLWCGKRWMKGDHVLMLLYIYIQINSSMMTIYTGHLEIPLFDNHFKNIYNLLNVRLAHLPWKSMERATSSMLSQCHITTAVVLVHCSRDTTLSTHKKLPFVSCHGRGRGSARCCCVFVCGCCGCDRHYALSSIYVVGADRFQIDGAVLFVVFDIDLKK